MSKIKLPKYGDPLSAGVNIAQQDFQNATGIRNEHDDDADLFRALGDIAGPRPRGGAALFSGIAKGLEYGARSKSTAKKQEALDKYNRVMDYFRETNNQMMERKKWYETREFAQKKYLPQVLTYAQNVNTLDPQSRRMMLDDILDGYNKTIGQDYKIASIDGSNPFIVTLQGKKGAQVVDIRNLFNDDENAQTLLNMQMPEYLKKQQEERQQKAFDNQMKERQVGVLEDRLDIERENAPLKYGIQQRRIDETSRRNDLNETKSDIKLNETLGKRIDSATEFLNIVPKMETIVKDHPDIFQSAMDAVWRENQNPGVMSNIIKDIQNKWNPEKATALTSMIKYINKMTLDVANGMARPNMFIEKIGSKAVPNLDMTPDAFLNVLHEMSDEKRREIKNNQGRLDRFTKDKELVNQYKESTAGVMGNQPNSPNASGSNEFDFSDLGKLVQ